MRDRLALLHAQAAYHRVSAESDAVVGAFLLALREGQSYDSPNYRWFASRYPHFLYIDRIVIATTQQRHGLGRLLYDDLLAFARTSGVGVVACEIDEDPPNPTSMRFHAARGFREVGSQVVGLRRKRVSCRHWRWGFPMCHERSGMRFCRSLPAAYCRSDPAFNTTRRSPWLFV